MMALSMGEELLESCTTTAAHRPLQAQVAQLFEESREDVYRYLMTLGLDPGRAQESVQEVFLRLYAALKKG